MTTMRRISPIPPEEKRGYINGAFQNNKSDWPQSSEKGPPHNEPGTSNEQDIKDIKDTNKVPEFMQVFQLSFKDLSLERMFKSYLYRTRNNMITFTFILGLSLNISGLVTGALDEPSNSKYYLIATSLFTVFNLLALSMLIAAYIFKKDISVPRVPWILFIWIVFLIQLFGINMTFGSLPVTPGSEMMWIACLCYYTFVLFPLRMRYCFILNLIMFLTHSVLVATIPLARSYGNVFDYGKMVSLQSNVWYQVTVVN